LGVSILGLEIDWPDIFEVCPRTEQRSHCRHVCLGRNCCIWLFQCRILTAFKLRIGPPLLDLLFVGR
jgi:hypothetical protein